MNTDQPTELADALAPWTARLPPGADDPAYTNRYRSLVRRGMHPAVAAVVAEKQTHDRNQHWQRIASEISA